MDLGAVRQLLGRSQRTRAAWARRRPGLQLIASVNFVVTTGLPVRSFFHVVSVT